MDISEFSNKVSNVQQEMLDATRISTDLYDHIQAINAEYEGGQRTMKSLHKFRHGLDTVLSWVCALLFAAMVVVGTYQIVTRYFFGRPSTVSEELLTYSFTWMALLSSALVFGKRDHMRMGFLADKITGTSRKVLEIISECLVLLLAAVVMLYGGVSIMKLTMTQVTASLGIPMGTVYTVLPLSGALIVVYSVLNIIDLATDSVEEHSSTSAE